MRHSPNFFCPAMVVRDNLGSLRENIVASALLLWRLSKAQTHAASVFVDEGNPRELERPLNRCERSAPRPGELMDGHHPGRPTLCRGEDGYSRGLPNMQKLMLAEKLADGRMTVKEILSVRFSPLEGAESDLQ